MNLTVMSGNLTRDAEVKTTTSGKTVANFTLAVRNGKDSDFFDCEAWEGAATFIQKGMADGRYLKGCEVEVQGQIRPVSYDSKDQQTGAVTKVKTVKMVVRESFSRRSKDWQPQQGGYQQAQQQGGYQAQQGGYQQPQRGGYQAQQAGYQQAPGGYQQAQQQAPAPQQGSYQQAPVPQGGYQTQQQAPAPQGGYQAQAQQATAPHGGYQAQQQAPAPPQGGYQAAPPAAQAPVTGSFQQIPAQNTQTQQGGFKAASVNAPRAGQQQASYGGYPEGAGYGN